MARLIDPITFNDQMDDGRQRVDALDQSLANIVRTAGPEAAAGALADFASKAGLTQREVDLLRPQLVAMNGALDENKLAAEASALAQGGAVDATGRLTDATGAAIPVTEAQKAALEEAKAAAEELQKVHEELAGALAGFVDPMQAFNTVLDANTAAAQRHAEGIAASTADTSDSWQQYASEATVSLDQFAGELQKQIDAQNNWADNLLTITARGREDVARELAKMGPEGAALVAAFATGTEAEMNRAGDLLMESVRRGSTGAGAELDTGMKIMAEIARQGAGATVQSVMDALGPMPGLTQELVRDTANRAQITLDEGKPAWDQSWGDRRTISLQEMEAMARDAPPYVRAAADLFNQHLADTNPAFAAEFMSRKGVAVDEMAKLLAESPPHVRDAAALYLAYLAEHKPGWDSQFVERRNFAVAEMDLAGRETAAAAARSGDGMTGALRDRYPPFQGIVGSYQTTLVSGIQTVAGATLTRTGGPGTEAGNAARRAYQADGGIVEFYAAGGMKEAHQAQIARAGDWRVWAEPETGGEAYIPLALAKRERSTGILEEVASRFGLVVRPANENEVLDYHQGGICGHSGCQHFHSGGLWTPPPHPQFADYGPPIRPAGAGTTHSMQDAVAEFVRRHMQEPHHTAPPVAGGTGGPVSGGKALDRVRSVLGEFPGARITSTYRSPAQNAAVGGAPNSLHMDRANPATDIGGPTATLDRMHARLRGMGGWRELLWRVRGHYDHIHAAEEGALFDSVRSYDQGGFLPPGVTLAYNGTGAPERILTMAEGALVGDTFYGGAGSERRRQRRFSDEEGAQFDYMNRRETRATPHAYLDYGTPHNRRDDLRPSEAYRQEWKDAMRGGGTGGAGTKPSVPAVIPVPVNQSADNSVNLTFSGPAVRVDVSAAVGADPAGMREGILTAVNQAFGAWQDSLKMEIRARRG